MMRELMLGAERGRVFVLLEGHVLLHGFKAFQIPFCCIFSGLIDLSTGMSNNRYPVMILLAFFPTTQIDIRTIC